MRFEQKGQLDRKQIYVTSSGNKKLDFLTSQISTQQLVQAAFDRAMSEMYATALLWQHKFRPSQSCSSGLSSGWIHLCKGAGFAPSVQI
jgi:hypothetical protein